MRKLIQTWVLLAVLSGHASTQAGPPDKHHEIQLGPGHTLKLWFNPQCGWRAKSYDQRYVGCMRQQEHRVYTADDEVLPRMLKNPSNLHWLLDPKEPGQEALYIGPLGLSGGMPPSRLVQNQANKDLSSIAVQATEQGKLGALRRVLGEAQEATDFDGVYEQVFGEGSSEETDFSIFDLTVGEVWELSSYSDLFAVDSLEGQDEEQVGGAKDELVVQAQTGVVLSSTDLVEGLYAPVESEEHQAVCRVLKFKKYEAEYNKALPRAVGLLYKQYVDGKDAEAYGLHVFWRYLLSDPRELVGICQVVLNMRCMEACRADVRGVLAKLHKPILDDITSWVLAACEVRIDVDFKGELLTTVPLLPALERVWGGCPHVLSYDPLAEGMLSRLVKWKKRPQKPKEAAGTLRTLARLLGAAWPSFVRESVLHDVSLGCKHGSSKVRQAAALGLSKGLGACSGEVWKAFLEALTGLCNDSHSDVRQAAALGLSKWLEGVCSEEGCSAIVEALTGLKGNDSDVCKEALGLSKGLRRARSEQCWKGVVSVLVGLCKDDAEWVHKAEAFGLSRGLGNGCSEEDRKAILEALKGLCRDQDWYVRREAASGLSKGLEDGCSEEARQGILETLKGLCKDRDSDVREVAALGLSKALEGTCSKEGRQAILEALQGLCKDEHPWVRGPAALGLSGGLEAEEYTGEGWKAILEVLTSLCKDEHWYVRRAAASGLLQGLEGECSEEGWEAILEALKGLCRDEIYSVRQAAALGLSKALEGCSEKGWKVILKVLKGLCRDDSEWVRQAAALGLSKALEGVSEEAWKAIVETLTGLCRDEHGKVRQAADQALVRAMDQQELLHVLMGSELSSPTLIQVIATYNPCLILPEGCDLKVSKRIQQALTQERHKRGWPKDLLGVRDLPSVLLPPEQGVRGPSKDEWDAQLEDQELPKSDSVSPLQQDQASRIKSVPRSSKHPKSDGAKVGKAVKLLADGHKYGDGKDYGKGYRCYKAVVDVGRHKLADEHGAEVGGMGFKQLESKACKRVA